MTQAATEVLSAVIGGSGGVIETQKMKRVYGLIGHTLTHSFSEDYFRRKFTAEGITDVEYRNYPLENIESLPDLMADMPELAGFNVTIPYKESVMRFLSAVDEAAASIGAVNCVRVDDGKLTGYNTDAPAFVKRLLEFIGSERPKALILGSGGASKAAAYSLAGLGMEYTTVSRTPGKAGLVYGGIDGKVMESHRLIVNTTPLGMYPDTGSSPPIPYDLITKDHFLYDLIYNPPLTEFLRRGEAAGAKTTNGYGMLAAQAEMSWEIWNK